MTQDQADQAQGTGAAGGQVIPDDETGASQTEESGAVTRLKKVASALRGDRPDQAAPGQTVSDETIPDPATPDEMAITDRGTQNPEQDATVNSAVAPDDMTDPEYASATRPADAGTAAGDVGTVPGSAAAGGYDQDGEQNVTAVGPRRGRGRSGPYPAGFGYVRHDRDQPAVPTRHRSMGTRAARRPDTKARPAPRPRPAASLGRRRRMAARPGPAPASPARPALRTDTAARPAPARIRRT